MQYRLSYLNKAGHITGARDLDCYDDRVALALANADTDPRDKELWQADRYLGQVPARLAA